jgi:transcription elongation factor Elf1
VSLRCLSCVEFKIECPKGYDSAVLKCGICGARYVMTIAACQWETFSGCTDCGSDVSIEVLNP